MEPRQHHKRWYDHIANVSHAVYISKQLPEPVQDIIARNLNEYIDTYRHLARNDKNAISLGASRVLGLYKAKYGHRWYDPNIKLSRAFNMMAIVPEHFLSEYADRVIQVANYVIRRQQQEQQPIHLPEVASTVKTMLDQSFVSLREAEGGFRLVGQDTPPVHNDSHVIAMSDTPPPETPHVIRHKKKRR